MSACDICGREKGPVPPLCGRDRPGATFPDMADCYSTGFYRLKREKTLAGQQIDALVADARAAYPVCSRCGEDLIPHDGELCGACAKSELSAAEERGRRAGIEEGIHRGVDETARLASESGMSGVMVRALVEHALRNGLAPRDSGTSCGADEDGIHREARKDRK